MTFSKSHYLPKAPPLNVTSLAGGVGHSPVQSSAVLGPEVW